MSALSRGLRASSDGVSKPPAGSASHIIANIPVPGLFLHHLKLDADGLGGTGADHDVKHTGLDDPVHIHVEHRERVGREGEFHRCFLAQGSASRGESLSIPSPAV